MKAKPKAAASSAAADGKSKAKPVPDLSTPGILYETPDQLAKRIGVHVRWLLNDRVGARLLPFVRIGTRVRYIPSQVDAAIKSGALGRLKRGTREFRQLHGAESASPSE